jgi:hypothetical protein
MQKLLSLLTLCAGAGLLAQPHTATAQAAFNTSHSNYSGLNGASWNPATLADSRYTLQLQLIGFDAHATTTAYRYTGKWSLLNQAEPMDLSKPYIVRNPDATPKMMSTGFNLRGPGLLLRLNARNTIAVSTRARMALQGNNVSSELIEDAENEFAVRKTSKGNTFNLNLNAFAEWNFSYGRVVFDHDKHFLKAGITVKRLSGIGSGYLQSRVLDYEVVPKSAANGDSTLHIKQLEGGFGYSNPDAFRDLDSDKALDWVKSGGKAGGGWGGDIGVVYEYRPDYDKYTYTNKAGTEKIDHSRSKYKYRVSAAITDIGAIRYRTNSVAYDPITTSRLNISEEDPKGIDGGNFDNKMDRFLQTWRYRKQTSFSAGLPMALNLDFDYHFWGRLYVNAAVSQGLRGKYAVGMRTFSYASLAPRLETKFLELSVPMSLANGYRTFTYGLLARVGPLAFGSNNIGALLGGGRPSGANAYVEFSLLNIGNKRHKAKKPAKVKSTISSPIPTK